MKKKINVAIIGLGRVGSTFLKKLLLHQSKVISIAAVAEKDLDARGIVMAKKYAIPLYEDIHDIVKMGDGIDVIFDLTGDKLVRQSLRISMVRSRNTHTVIAPEIMAFLLWDLMSKGGKLPDAHAFKGY